ncbi:DUF2459 domain-containing protein [uncultured Tenacibaculum sp.]|uniref:DUF2459 domain-containing protein n=1 Tax=uncultured Tenacibaculum sp. TaxID=174713 RepID=UPI002617CA8F|nr:DUF2459 domain-containing protein [uncultured Tenacibaculum sp.]
MSILLYIGISILISFITVNDEPLVNQTKFVYLSSNGIHLSIIIPKQNLSLDLNNELQLKPTDNFIRFGWGDENFYMNTPTWADFKFKYAFGALFLDNQTLIEVSSHRFQQKKWVKVPVNETQLFKLNVFISETFQVNKKEEKIILTQTMYPNSKLYKAKGSYSPLKTCNTWVNDGFKSSGMKASYWTLFDFGLLNKYKK